MFNSFVNPVAMDAIGWKYYTVYIAILVVISAVIYLFYAETKGYSLEEISDIFEGPAIVAGKSRHHRQVHEVTALEKEPAVTEVENIESA
jgi:hypothetical protein